jgi:2-hydroxychromene-2-carboxylate isomerase
VAGEVTMSVAEQTEVVNIARRVTRDPAAELLEWTAAPLAHVGIIDTTGGLYRVVGRVRSDGSEVSWSCVLKVLQRSSEDECLDPASWCYWRREAAFYGSELATGLPGPLRAPRAYGVIDRTDGVHVWMEYVAAPDGRWGLEDFRRAARAAGLSAGAFLVGRPLPDEPWLARGFLRSLLADGGFWATRMHPETGGAWHSPLAEPFGARTRERVLQVWANRDALLSIMDGLPHVFGHGDLHPRNILLAAGGDEVVVLDWAFCGPFPLGTDLADLVYIAAWFCDVEIAELATFEQVAFTAYEDGLRTAGWDGDARLARLGFATAVALRRGACMPGWAVEMLGPEQARSSELLYGRPVDAVLAAWIALEDVCLDLADEARVLAPQLGLAQP